MTTTAKVTTDRFDLVQKYAGRRVYMMNDWQGNAMSSGVIEKVSDDHLGHCPFGGPENSIHIAFHHETWIVSCDLITLPGEQVRSMRTFVDGRGLGIMSIEDVAFIVYGAVEGNSHSTYRG